MSYLATKRGAAIEFVCMARYATETDFEKCSLACKSKAHPPHNAVQSHGC